MKNSVHPTAPAGMCSHVEGFGGTSTNYPTIKDRYHGV